MHVAEDICKQNRASESRTILKLMKKCIDLLYGEPH